MAQSINLIPQSEVIEQTKVKVVKTTTVLSIILLVVITGASGFLLYQRMGMKKKNASLESEISQLRKDIKDLSFIEITARNLDKKYNALASLFSSRIYYSDLLTELDKRRPDTVTIDSFSLRDKTNLMITGDAQTYMDISTFTANLLKKKVEGGVTEDPFSKVTLNSVSLNKKDGTVNFTIAVVFKEGAFQR